MRLLGILPFFFLGCAIPDAAIDEVSTIGDLGDVGGITHDLSTRPADFSFVQSPVDDLSNPPSPSPDLAQVNCTPSSVVINEIQTAGLSATDEWVELYNTCAGSVSLSGLSLLYRAGMGVSDSTVATLNGNITANGFILIANSGYLGIVSADFSFQSSGLASGGGQLALKSSSGIIDAVGWGLASGAYVEGSPAQAPATLNSIGRHPDGADTQNNASDFQIFTSPTPRATNQ